MVYNSNMKHCVDCDSLFNPKQPTDKYCDHCELEREVNRITRTKLFSHDKKNAKQKKDDWQHKSQESMKRIIDSH